MTNGTASSAVSSIERAAQFIADALAALLPFVGTNDASGEPIRLLVRQLGWELPGPVPSSLIALRPSIAALAENSARASALLEKARSGDEPSIEETAVILTALVAALGKTITDLSQLNGKLASELPPAFISATQINQKFSARLLDTLFIEAALKRIPAAVHALRLLGIFEISEQEADPTSSQPAFIFRQIHWERIPQFFEKPSDVFEDAYGWGTPDLKLEPLLDALAAMASAHGIYDYPSKGLIAAVAPGVDPKTADIERSFEMPIIDAGLFKVITGVTSIPKASPGEIQGLAVALFITGGTTKIEIPLTTTVSLIISGSLEGSTTIALVFRPGQTLTVISDFDGTHSPVTGGELNAALSFKAPSETEPLTLLSIPGGSRFELHAGFARGGFIVGGGAPPDFVFELGIDQGRFILGGGQGDGFLNQILPSNGIRSDFQLVVGFSFAHGIYFRGSASLEIQLPIHVSLGPIEIQALYLLLAIRDGKLPLEISSMIRANLGPLQAVVERLGVMATVDFPPDGGNLGPINLGLGFKPPNGIGLSLDTGVVKGGGYLYFDFDKEEYAGVLELSFSGIVTITAIGLLTTRMPDGSKGFSLLIIISVEFGTGIQLGFGFTLLGLGGLLGLNRTMRLDALTEGVRTGSINNIMFPRDVVANAPRIISDMRTFFPPEEGKFLIGPFAKIGWGTPTLVSVSLGIIIEIPGNIAIIGVLRVALPADDAALIILQVSFIGAIEFDKKRIFFFASLFESRILYITLEGEMGLLIAFGDDANFVLSVGGFHPRFNPPPLPFPSPRRIAFDIIHTPTALIRVEGYFAVTSNTVQFGAHADLRFGFDDFGIEGHIGFDVLIQFSPFYFIAEISASVSLKAFGVGLFSIRLRFSLEGPTPYRAKGSGSISLLFFEISADFDITWGESRDTSLPPIAVILVLKGEFEKMDNWRALLPAGNNLLVALRKFDAPANTVVLHPVGTLRISQKAVPLDLSIDKVGNQKPNDAKHFSVSVSSGGLGKKGDAQEQFAIGQYQDMDDATKLSRPAFQLQNGGIELSVTGQDVNSSRVAKRIVRYEEIIIDNNYKRFVRRFRTLASALFVHFLKGASVSQSSLSQHYAQQRQPFVEKITVKDEAYAVAFQSNNQAFNGTATFSSEASAREFMQQQIALDPNQSGTLHVIPQYEVMS